MEHVWTGYRKGQDPAFETPQRRADLRVKETRLCAYTVSEFSDQGTLQTREGYGTIHDVSPDGMQIEVHEPLPVPRIVEVRTGDPGGRESLWLVEVRWMRRVPLEATQSRWFLGGRLLFARAV